MKHYILSFFLLIYIATSTKAQFIPHKKLTVNDGLPSSEVYHCIQDKKGFLWFATDKGISYYNGYTFTNYDLSDNLPRATVFELFEDNYGRIWAITVTGELAYIKDKQLTRYKYNNTILKHKKRSQYPVKRSFYADSLDNVYISFECTPILHIDSTGNLNELGESDSNVLHVEYMTHPSSNILFTSHNICKYPDFQIEVNKPNQQHLKIPSNIKRPLNGIRSIAIAYSNSTIFTLNNKLIVINDNGETRNYSFDKNIIWISKDRNGLIWLGFVDDGAKAFRGTNFNHNLYHLAPNESVSSILCDNDNAYWLTTLMNGVYYYPLLDMNVFSQKLDFLLPI